MTAYKPHYNKRTIPDDIAMRPLTEQDIPEIQELFRKETRICQSCGLPMPSEDLLGTHGDGHPCTEYCILRFHTREATLWIDRKSAHLAL